MRRRPAEQDLAPSGQDQLLQSRLAYHLRCLREDATDLELARAERLALVRERAVRIREIRQELDQAKRHLACA